MLRRLYFILPSTASVSTLVRELQESGIDSGHITVASREPVPLQQLGIRLQNDIFDRGARIERLLWTLNLVVFVFALIVTLGLLFTRGLSPALLIPVLIMAACFGAGLRFTHVPNVHLEDLADALNHGELILMTDVPPGRVAEIESLVHRRHPEAGIGGVGWWSDVLKT